MIGSPNYVRFVYDGDGSLSAWPGRPDRTQIEAFFDEFYASQRPGLGAD